MENDEKRKKVIDELERRKKIVFNKSEHELEYASITFRKDKENGADIDK